MNGWRIKRPTPSTERPAPESPSKPPELAPDIAQVIGLVAEIMLDQHRKQTDQKAPVEAA